MGSPCPQLWFCTSATGVKKKRNFLSHPFCEVNKLTATKKTNLEGVLEKTLESSLVCKEVQPVHPKGHQSWVFTGRTDVEAELQYFGSLI